MPQGRHRIGAVERPSSGDLVRRLPRDLRLSVASATVGATLLGAASMVAAAWPDTDTAGVSDVRAAAIRQQLAAQAADALQVLTRSQSEERTSRARTGTPTGATAQPAQATTPDRTAAGGAGPGRAPARGGAGGALVAAGLSGAACPISGSIEAHLTANARAVYRAVCAAFPGVVSSYGGYRAGSPGDHGTGRAVDIMVSGDPGLAIARFVQAHAAALHVTYVIYQQKIWLVGNPTSDWRPMADRGSRTANHYDHVHVSVA